MGSHEWVDYLVRDIILHRDGDGAPLLRDVRRHIREKELPDNWILFDIPDIPH